MQPPVVLVGRGSPWDSLEDAQRQAAALQAKPVKLTPEPKGRWRWIGTRTILFDPEIRFPQATTTRRS